MALKFAFEGEAQRLRFVSARPAGITMGGLSLVGLEVAQDSARKSRHLTMRRAMPDDEAKDFAPLDRAEPTVLIADVESVTFAYFGSENDFSESKWMDAWTYVGRMPQMVRLRVKTVDGALPELVVRVMLGEEAGCLENSFQRLCRPRRPPPE